MSRVMPYRPMGPQSPLAGEAEVSAMFEKLGRRAKATSASSTAHAAPEPPKPLLRWMKPVVDSSTGTARITSECRGFQIERRESNGVRTYYAMTHHPEFRHEIGRGKSADEAKAICEVEAGRRAARSTAKDAGHGG